MKLSKVLIIVTSVTLLGACGSKKNSRPAVNSPEVSSTTTPDGQTKLRARGCNIEDDIKMSTAEVCQVLHDEIKKEDHQCVGVFAIQFESLKCNQHVAHDDIDHILAKMETTVVADDGQGNRVTETRVETANGTNSSDEKHSDEDQDSKKLSPHERITQGQSSAGPKPKQKPKAKVSVKVTSVETVRVYNDGSEEVLEQTKLPPVEESVPENEVPASDSGSATQKTEEVQASAVTAKTIVSTKTTNPENGDISVVVEEPKKDVFRVKVQGSSDIPRETRFRIACEKVVTIQCKHPSDKTFCRTERKKEKEIQRCMKEDVKVKVLKSN